MTDSRRDLPSVNALLESAGVRSLLEQHPRRVVLEAVRSAVNAARDQGGAQRTEQQWVASIASAVQSLSQPSLRRVINATGVVLHTNLGRAPLAESAVKAIAEIAVGFSNLEYDLATGERGSRYSHCVGLLRQLTGAEDALVVNNCAAAMVLALNALAQRKEVLVSRGELVAASAQADAGGPSAVKTDSVSGPAADPTLSNPAEAYRTEIREALMDAMLEHSRGLGIASGEWLVIAARGNYERAPLAPADSGQAATPDD